MLSDQVLVSCALCLQLSSAVWWWTGRHPTNQPVSAAHPPVVWSGVPLPLPPRRPLHTLGYSFGLHIFTCSLGVTIMAIAYVWYLLPVINHCHLTLSLTPWPVTVLAGRSCWSLHSNGSLLLFLPSSGLRYGRYSANTPFFFHLIHYNIKLYRSFIFSILAFFLHNGVKVIGAWCLLPSINVEV